MATLELTHCMKAPIDLTYGVVADVERYPEFLSDVVVAERRDDLVSMKLCVGLLPVTLVTRASFRPPEAIDLVQVSGPFRRFEGRWRFRAVPEGTEVTYRADYELPIWGGLFGGPAGALLVQAARRQIQAFEARILALLDSSASAG